MLVFIISASSRDSTVSDRQAKPAKLNSTAHPCAAWPNDTADERRIESFIAITVITHFSVGLPSGFVELIHVRKNAYLTTVEYPLLLRDDLAVIAGDVPAVDQVRTPSDRRDGDDAFLVAVFGAHAFPPSHFDQPHERQIGQPPSTRMVIASQLGQLLIAITSG